MRVDVLSPLKGGRAFIGLVLFFALLQPGLAQTEEEESSQWAVGLGAGWIPDYPGAATGRMRYFPFPVLRGSALRMDRLSGVSGDVYQGSRWDFTWNFLFQFPTRSELIPVREGMPNLDWLLSIGPQVNYSLYRSKNLHTFVRFPIRLNTCTNFGNQTRFCGIAFNPGVWHVQRTEKWGEFTYRMEAYSHSSEYQNYFYGVAPQFATPTRPTFQARAGFLGFLYGVFHSMPFDGWELSTAMTFYDYSLAINHRSPLFLHKSNYAIFTAVIIDI